MSTTSSMVALKTFLPSGAASHPFSPDFATILIFLMRPYAGYKVAHIASPRTLSGTDGKWMTLLIAGILLFYPTARSGSGDKDAPAA